MSKPDSRSPVAGGPASRRALPSVGSLLEEPDAVLLAERFGRPALTGALRSVLGVAREGLKEGVTPAPGPAALLAHAAVLLESQQRSSLQPVLNLTGIVLHTNLGRALLAERAVAAATTAMRENVTLEYERGQGARGERDDHVRGLLGELTGAQDALVVNNNAAAVLLCLNTLALGREAVVSRGELIEIGGAFRMPDIMTRAGALMREVGTTNRTHLRDYREALGPRTGLILKVHTSNYRVQGFTAEVGAGELASLAREGGVPLVHDMGSGNLSALAGLGLKQEPTVQQAVADGAGLVTFSGDKLLGGPQAGLIVGERRLIQLLRENPLRRALRVDKIRLAALEATLQLYRDPGRLAQHLPTMVFLARTRAQIEAVARELLPQVTRMLGSGFEVEVCACESEVGSGALPLDTLGSAGLAIRPHGGRGADLERLARALRELPHPVIGRIRDGRLVLDLRCLREPRELPEALAAFGAAAPGD
ncbi:MAG TPA: L-seryl-tRNA(Sec) selenium transferase [Steroidobacteraceae bacterium]|nr:L-seryl-tRNA(Sec) selenium transferase [Steroidobacteraceae bacterium]